MAIPSSLSQNRVSGSLPRMVTQALKKAHDASDGVLQSFSLASTTSARFDISQDAWDYMVEEGIIDQEQANQLAATMANMLVKDREVSKLGIKYI